MAMLPVVQCTSYGRWDTLDGATLQDGERLTVRWPDHDETWETVRIQREAPRGSDGAVYEEAYIETGLRGAICRVYLRQDAILCERSL